MLLTLSTSGQGRRSYRLQFPGTYSQIAPTARAYELQNACVGSPRSEISRLLVLTLHPVVNIDTMPAPAGQKRNRGVQVFRPFVYGTIATPFDPNNRPPDAPAEHTHQWRVFVEGINGADISYWLKKVQLKLHDSFAQNIRMIEGPPFEVVETGWGEFEIAIKFYFVPESTEKPQTVWHSLKLHPYGDDIEGKKARRDTVKSICYEEVLFNEPVDAFLDMLTSDGVDGHPPKAKAKGKAKKETVQLLKTAEIPQMISKDNLYSREEESKELDRLGEAVKEVEKLIGEEKTKIIAGEQSLQGLEKTEGKPPVLKKK